MSSGGGSNPFESPFKFLDKFGFNISWIIFVLALIAMYFAYKQINIGSNKVLSYIVATIPLWLPFIAFSLMHHEWLLMKQKKFDLKQRRATLELRIPQEVFKSPEAMELVFVQMYQTASPDNHFETYIDGKHPPIFALELVSRGGDVRMYINTPISKYKNMIETQLYAHYPGIEVHELDIDYTAEFPWDPERFDYFSTHYGLKNPDAYPIKTYIEYGMQMLPKEELKIDPLNSVFEMLGSVTPNEHVWIQILITANRKSTFKEGSIFESPDWKGAAQDEIQNIINKAAKRVGVSAESKGANVNQYLTDAEKETIRAIERSIGKLAFNMAIRGMYITKKDFFNGDMLGVIKTAFRAFDDVNRNSIGARWRTDFDWNWWQDPGGKKRIHMKEAELDEYKRRTYEPRDSGLSDSMKVMTTEELATIFHIPGKVATTPTLSRIPSKRAEPPANLPVG